VTAIELYYLDLVKSIMNKEHPAADNVILSLITSREGMEASTECFNN
jgi:hypothetical protein